MKNRRKGHQERSREPRDAAVVGRRPALEAIRSGSALEVFVSESAQTTAGLRAVLEAAGNQRIPVTWVTDDVIDGLAAGARHQRVAVRVTTPPPLDERALQTWAWATDAVVLVLDGVTDPQNVGAAARTAEAAGAAAMIVRRYRGASSSPAALKASAGALFHLPLARVTNITRSLRTLKELGFWVAGLDGGASQTIRGARRPPGRLALVVGSEGSGLSRLVRESCDELVAIPLTGKAESLNVAVAAGVGLFTYADGGSVRGAK
jgi:23S rRNA (guanosine2251-2'-O)-methyltransferase